MEEVEDGNVAKDSAGEYWRSRGYLPHYDEPGLFQMITLRLHDSMPAHKLAELSRESHQLTKLQIRNALENTLDANHGACYLRNPQVAALAQDTLLHFDGERYHLLAWVIMPNHLHALAQFRAEFPLTKVMHSWKSYIANKGNKLLGRSGEFWQREYFDRYIRNAEHYRNAVAYIEANPVKARLCEYPELWQYSSANWKTKPKQSAPIS